jgi:hypothetical protein
MLSQWAVTQMARHRRFLWVRGYAAGPAHDAIQYSINAAGIGKIDTRAITNYGGSRMG